MALWTKITEGVVARKATNINVPEMDDMSAQLVINEALYEAGAASFAAIEISESITAFGVSADARGLSAMQYIAEAFSVGGFFGKIIEFLKKMWNTIVNYFKALIGNKFGASGNIIKLSNKFDENMKIIKAKLDGGEYKADDEIKVKKYELKKAGRIAGVIVNPDLYLKTDMLDSVSSSMWDAYGAGSDGKGFNIYNITRAAAALAKSVKDNQVKPEESNKKDIDDYKSSIEKAVSDIKSLTSKLSLGDKGAAETLMILLEKKWKNDADLKKTFEDSKAKDSKSLTELLRKLLEHLFPAGGATANLSAQDAYDILSSTDVAITTSFSNAEATAAAANGALALVDPVKAALQYCTDILDQLNKAGEDIKSMSSSEIVAGKDVKNTQTNKTEFKADEDQESSVGLAGKMTELGNELTKLSSNMQAVVTKGMDAAAVLIETIYKEMVGQTELLIKASTGSRTKSKVQ